MSSETTISTQQFTLGQISVQRANPANIHVHRNLRRAITVHFVCQYSHFQQKKHQGKLMQECIRDAGEATLQIEKYEGIRFALRLQGTFY